MWENETNGNDTLINRRLKRTDYLCRNLPRFALPTPFGVVDYVRCGVEGRPTVLFIPGVPDQLYTFHQVIIDLAKTFDVLAVSPPGKGYSGYAKNFDFSIASYAAFWQWIAETFRLQDTIVVAHSYGLAEIMHAFSEYSSAHKWCTGLISVCGWSPAVLPEPLPLTLEERLLGSQLGPWIYRNLSRSPFFGVERSFQRHLRRHRDRQGLSEMGREYLRSWPGMEVENPGAPDLRRIRGICESVRQQNRLSARSQAYHQSQKKSLANLRGFPILVVGASDDSVVRGRKARFDLWKKGKLIRFNDERGLCYAERLFHALDFFSRHPRNAIRFIEHTGHLLPLEASAELSEVIATFVDTSNRFAVPTATIPAWSMPPEEIAAAQLVQAKNASISERFAMAS